MNRSEQGPRNTIASWVSRSNADRGASLDLMSQRARRTAHAHDTYITRIDPRWGGSGGLLSGVPFAVKDNIAVEGHPTTGGSLSLQGLLLSPTSAAVRSLQDAGGIIMGKANLHEFALGVTSDNASYGQVRNPANPAHSAGGSSGGSASAVASGSVPFALGTDTGGSMTIPAAFCGIVGMRPTHGRYPSDGLVSISPSRDTIGVMANTVADVALVDTIITDGQFSGTATTRWGVPRAGLWAGLDPRVRHRGERALDELAVAGFDLVEIDLTEPLERALAHRRDLVGYEAPRALRLLLNRYGIIAPSDRLVASAHSSDVREILEGMETHPVTASQYAAALALRAELEEQVNAILDEAGIELLVYPSSPVTAPALGATTVQVEGVAAPVFDTITRSAELASMLGHPMISIPVAHGGGLPVGLTLEGRRGRDRDLLATAERAEHVFGASRSVQTSEPLR